MDWNRVREQALREGSISREQALAVLRSGPDELLAVLDAAFQVRRTYWDRGVNLHVLRNAKSGLCRENCAFCSQAIGAYSGVDRYGMQGVEELVAGAREAAARQAVKYCMVTATRGPSERELDVICEAVRRIKRECRIQICTSLGLLTRDQAFRLKEAGVDRFNHNLESSSRFYPEICQTHGWQERVETIRYVREAGMEVCCGGIVGMGETDEDRVDLAFTLRELEVESIPVNFLDPRPGTPLGNLDRLPAADALRALCMFRLVNPTRDIRAAGGREVCLGPLQALCLYPANSMFTEGYLTTPGQSQSQDVAMIRAAGFYVREIVEEDTGDPAAIATTATADPVRA
jgi:biotin synthase